MQRTNGTSTPCGSKLKLLKTVQTDFPPRSVRPPNFHRFHPHPYPSSGALPGCVQVHRRLLQPWMRLRRKCPTFQPKVYYSPRGSSLHQEVAYFIQPLIVSRAHCPTPRSFVPAEYLRSYTLTSPTLPSTFPCTATTPVMPKVCDFPGFGVNSDSGSWCFIAIAHRAPVFMLFHVSTKPCASTLWAAPCLCFAAQLLTSTAEWSWRHSPRHREGESPAPGRVQALFGSGGWLSHQGIQNRSRRREN